MLCATHFVDADDAIVEDVEATVTVVPKTNEVFVRFPQDVPLIVPQALAIISKLFIAGRRAPETIYYRWNTLKKRIVPDSKLALLVSEFRSSELRSTNPRGNTLIYDRNRNVNDNNDEVDTVVGSHSERQ